MVKHFLLEQNFNCSLLTFFQTFIQDPTFCEKFHHNCGDSNIFITEWISVDKDIWQRFCFFTIKLDVTDVNGTKCIETQKYWNEKDAVLLHCFITPDHSLTGLFRIESNWKIVQIEVGDHRSECKVTIHVSVECKKRWFGFQNVMEAVLSDKVKDFYEQWLKLASITQIEMHKHEQSTSSKNSEVNCLETTSQETHFTQRHNNRDDSQSFNISSKNPTAQIQVESNSLQRPVVLSFSSLRDNTHSSFSSSHSSLPHSISSLYFRHNYKFITNANYFVESQQIMIPVELGEESSRFSLPKQILDFDLQIRRRRKRKWSFKQKITGIFCVLCLIGLLLWMFLSSFIETNPNTISLSE